MQRAIKIIGEIMGMVIFLVAIVVFVTMLQQNNTSKQVAPTCPPPLLIQTTSSTPILPIGSPTPLPKNFAPPSPQIATPVVFPISRIVDMDPGLPVEQKGEAIVCKPDGTYVKILTIPEIQVAELPLAPGDVLVAVYSPRDSMGQHPPKLTATPELPVTP